MRKVLALFTVIFLIYIVLYSAIFVQINKEKDNVVVTETVVYGDKSYAEGIKFMLDTRLTNQAPCKILQWKTEYTLGDEPITETDLRIAYNGIKHEYKETKNISLYTTFNFTTTGVGFNGIFKNIGNVYEEMMKDAVPYTEQKKTILLTDYFDYYPLVVDIDFPNYYLNNDLVFSENNLTDAEIAIIENFNNYFKIPIVEGEKIQLSAIANEQGNIFQWGTSATDENRFDAYITGQVTNDKCFFSFSNRTADGNTVDTSHIPEGYGVYCLPYTENNNSVQFSFEILKNIYPVDAKNEVIGIHLSDDSNSLYIVTKEGNKSILTVMDVNTFEKKLSLELDSFKSGYSYINYVGSNFILFNTYNGTEDGFFYTVVSVDEKENYKKEITVFADYYGDVIKWDGECLYFASNDSYDEADIVQPCRFKFTVYNKEGLKFHGKYDLSLGTGYDGNYSSDYYVYLGNDRVDFILPS